MKIIKRQHNVLKKASGSWAEPYSTCPGLMPQGLGYTLGIPMDFGLLFSSGKGIPDDIPVINKRHEIAENEIR